MFLPKAFPLTTFPGSTQLSPDAWSSPNDTHFQQKMPVGTIVLSYSPGLDGCPPHQHINRTAAALAIVATGMPADACQGKYSEHLPYQQPAHLGQLLFWQSPI